MPSSSNGFPLACLACVCVVSNAAEPARPRLRDLGGVIGVFDPRRTRQHRCGLRVYVRLSCCGSRRTSRRHYYAVRHTNVARDDLTPAVKSTFLDFHGDRSRVRASLVVGYRCGVPCRVHDHIDDARHSLQPFLDGEEIEQRGEAELGDETDRAAEHAVAEEFELRHRNVLVLAFDLEPEKPLPETRPAGAVGEHRPPVDARAQDQLVLARPATSQERAELRRERKRTWKTRADRAAGARCAAPPVSCAAWRGSMGATPLGISPR